MLLTELLPLDLLEQSFLLRHQPLLLLIELLLLLNKSPDSLTLLEYFFSVEFCLFIFDF